MNEFLVNLPHLAHERFSNFFHLCFIVAIIIFCVGNLWMFVRVLIPLQKLVKHAQAVQTGQYGAVDLPRFDMPLNGIREIELLRIALNTMIGQVNASHEREIAYRVALTDSQENERRRLARELHDDTTQSLIYTSHMLDRAAQAAQDAQADSAVVIHLKTARKQVITTIDSLRCLISNLRPTWLEELGLVTSIEMLCDQLPNASFKIDGCQEPVGQAQELVLFRTAQEAIRNVERHAHAEHVNVRLIYAPCYVTLEVSDNGRGFHVPTQIQDLAIRGHFGLVGIYERVNNLGGELTVCSAPNGGTRLKVVFPRLENSTLALPMSALTSVQIA